MFFRAIPTYGVLPYASTEVSIAQLKEVTQLTVNRIFESDDCLHRGTMTMQSTGDTKVQEANILELQGCKKGIARSK